MFEFRNNNGVERIYDCSSKMILSSGLFRIVNSHKWMILVYYSACYEEMKCGKE